MGREGRCHSVAFCQFELFRRPAAGVLRYRMKHRFRRHIALYLLLAAFVATTPIILFRTELIRHLSRNTQTCTTMRKHLPHRHAHSLYSREYCYIHVFVYHTVCILLCLVNFRLFFANTWHILVLKTVCDCACVCVSVTASVFRLCVHVRARVCVRGGRVYHKTLSPKPNDVRKTPLSNTSTNY